MYILVGALSAILLIILLVSYVAFRMTFLFRDADKQELYHGLNGELDDIKKRRRELIERIENIPCEDVYTESLDGKKLHARYYHVSDEAPLAIQFHGYKSMALRDFSGVGYECISRGHNLLLVDQRAHGKSQGSIITFGAKERFDVKSWIAYSLDRFGESVQIMLYGISMGAGTVLMASELELPKNVVGIVADCPFSSTKAIIKKVIKDMGLPPKLLYPFVKLGALIFGRFNPDASSPVSAVKNTEIPILLIHGTGDTFVPCEMSDEINANGQNLTFVKIKDAAHALAYLYDSEKYNKALDNFINERIGDS